MRRLALKSLAFCLAMSLVNSVAIGGEIGWLETFSLSTDREAALRQLIPGTEDYYYYHCLHYLNNEQWDKVDEMLKPWIQRYQYSSRVVEIQNRQALLTYDKNPQRALALITSRLNLQFNHQREQLNQKSNLPTKLDAGLLSSEQLNKLAFGQFPNTLQGFNDQALDWLVKADLNAEQRRQLVSRLQRPDYPGLVQLVLADLDYQASGGFGQFEIHKRLLLEQLDELLKLKPDLRNQSNFIVTYLLRLRPSDDVNWRQDRAALGAYLDRLWAYVKTLDPAQNSLKAHVLYHRLLLNRELGKYDQDLLLEYLKLPKHVRYMQPKYLADNDRQRFAVNLQQDFSALTQLPMIGDDEPLVRSYLMHFFVEAVDYKIFKPYVSDVYLKELFAETKIVNGLGDVEKLYAMLPPEKYQQLKERIDLEFAFTNQTEFAVADPVALDLYVKNVDTLIVKVFEINTPNYYRENLHEIGPDVNLDGLVANQEQTYTYKEPALQRVKRHFDFASLDHRGVYVIDFIGNGKASRALVRKGKLRYLVRNSVAGHVFTILDEQNKTVAEPSLWLAGTLYSPGKDGTIMAPYSAQAGQQPIVLSSGAFASLETFGQQSENYQLAAAIYVDREELLARRKAEIIVRAQLALNGTPVSRKSLEEVRLQIISTDLDNIVSTLEVPDFKLYEDRESRFELQVPQRLASLRVILNAKIQNNSRNQKQDLAAEQTFALNAIDRTDKTEDVHFSHLGDDYVLDVLGKTGEQIADRPIQAVFKLRDYTQPVSVALQTSAAGRVTLGALPGVVQVTANLPNGVSHTWNIRHDQHSYPSDIHAEAGDVIEVPYMGQATKPDRAEVSLVELRGDQYLTDRFENMAVKNGMYTLSKLPVGDYSLLLKPDNISIHLRITAGLERQGYILGAYRKLQRGNPQPLQLQSVDVSKESLKIQLHNANPLTRVHVFATRVEPAFAAYDNLARIAAPGPRYMLAPRGESQYVAGRNIGDEYRYIIDRKFAHKYPGNMLERPSLLLNPWAIRSTETGEQHARGGEMFTGAGKRAESSTGEGRGGGGTLAQQGDFANLDFLAESSLVLSNMQADKNGNIEIKLADLTSHQQVLIVAVDATNTVSRLVTLPETKSEFLDLRLAKALDAKQHYMQQKRVTTLSAGQSLTIPDITSTKFEVYDSLVKLYALEASLNRDGKLLEFGFIRNWDQLKPEEKRQNYLKFASHELHFFIYKKDPAYFKAAIRPYLANKKEKQFLDHWLLENDLSDYFKPWNYEQLNTFERILLAQRTKGETNTARLIKDQFNLLPPDPERFSHLFATALKGSAMESDDALGIRDAQTAERLTLSSSVALDPARMDQPVISGGTLTPAVPHEAKMPRPAAKPRDMAEDKMKQLGSGKKADMRKDAARFKEQSKSEEEGLADERVRLAEVQQYYRKLDKTMEWVESNYYHLPLEQQGTGLITANSFWNEYAQHDPDKPFVSTEFAEASHNFPEMLLALSLVGLPVKAAAHKTAFDGTKMTFTPGGPAIVYHQEIQPTAKVAEHTPILVSQNFYRHGDRVRQVNNEQLDKFVTEEFLINTVYGCQIVVTNPSSSRKKIEVLVQIPAGAMPVTNGQYTRSVHLDLEPYHTQTLEYQFYFPLPGKFEHYPVQVASGDEVLAFAQAFTFNVVKQLTNIDKQSWDYISQHGSGDDVIEFLKTQNILRVSLDRIAWRMQDKAYYEQVLKLLDERHIYSQTLWSYSVKHNDKRAIRQFLQFANDFVAQTGDWLDSPLLVIDPITRKAYEQLDYRPLVNARVGRLGEKREILNDRFFAQYQRLLKILSYRQSLNDTELMTVTYYLLLQDRVDDALEHFGRVKADKLATRLQYDYFTAYMKFYQADSQAARQIATKYTEYPIERWRTAFTNIVNQADEIDQRQARVADPLDRTQVQNSQAAATPSLEFTVEGKQVKLTYQNLQQVSVNYYLMDIELLFSRNPFVQGESKQFSHILPNQSQVLKLPEKSNALEFTIPEKLQSSNVLVEIVGDGATQSKTYFSNDLRVQIIENYGEVRVTHGKDAAPLPKVYVKVYARMKNGEVRFYKDGYTDLRGRLDYASLNTNELEFVDKFSLLVLSEDHGAVVREAKPPKQ